MTLPRIAACLLALAAFASNAGAAWSPNGVNIGYASVGHYGVSLYSDGSNGVLAGWRAQFGGGYSITQNRIGADGVPYTNWGWSSANVGMDNDIVPDGQGGLYFTWCTNNPSLDIYAQNIIATGGRNFLWPPFGLQVATTGGQEFDPAAAAADSGGLYVSWNVGFTALVLKRLTTAGTPVAGWPAGGVQITNTPVVLANRIITDGANGVMVAWANDSLRVVRVSPGSGIASGWPVAGLALGVATDFGIDDGVRLIPSGPDHFFAFWTSSVTNGPITDVTLRVQRFHRNGTIAAGWLPGGFAIPRSSSYAPEPSAISDGQSGIILAWRQDLRVRALRILPAGSIVGSWTVGGGIDVLDAGAVLTASGSPVYSMATGPGGGAIVAWTDGRNAPRRSVRVRWITGTGAPDGTQPATGRIASPVDTLGAVRATLADGNGGVFVAWQRDDSAISSDVFLRLTWLPYPIPLAAPEPSTGPTRAGLALAPNPASRTCDVRFDLPNGTAARLELLDLAGRRVASRDIVGAGPHVERFGNLDALPPGIYLVRLTHGSNRHTARVAIVR